MIIERLKITELLQVSQLIERAFDESVAPTLSEEGVVTFKSGLTPESIQGRLDHGNPFIVCRSDTSIVQEYSDVVNQSQFRWLKYVKKAGGVLLND